MNSYSFNIAFYNIKGFKYRNPYIKKISNLDNVIFIQEHWLFQFEFHLINNVLPNFEYIMKSSMNNDSLTHGRPFGGVGILWNKNLNLSYTELKCVSDRVCAVRLFNDTFSITIVNVYMPFRGTLNNDVLLDIETVLNFSDYELIVVGGDFNCDFKHLDNRT